MDETSVRIVEREQARERSQSIARIALAVALVALGCFILQDFLRPLIWAGVLTIAVAPLYSRLRDRLGPGRHDTLLALAFSIVTALLFALPLILIGVQLAHESRGIIAWMNEVRVHGLPPPAWLGRVPFMHEQIQHWWAENLADPDGARALVGHADRFHPVQMGRALGAAILHRMVDIFFTVMILFFCLREGPTLGPRLLYACRRLFGPQGEPVARQMANSIHGTVDGLVLVGLGEGLVLGIGYAIVGAPHPALLGFLTAIAAVIPGLATIVPALAAVLVIANGNMVGGVALLVLGLSFIFIADHTIRPVLIGGATKLPFLWVLLGILGGLETLGLLGLFVGPAVMAALMLLWREWTRDATRDPSP